MSARTGPSAPVLAVEDLTMHYSTRAGPLRAVDGASFSVERGRALGLVGESGCGKSSIALALLRLLPDNASMLGGRILLDGEDLTSASEERMRECRWDRISMVFQAAMNSLNPVYRVGDQIAEALLLHLSSAPEEALGRVRGLYELVGLDPEFIGRYPHEYSGGMKQRAVIAMALACEPDVIIADEPTTALDVIVQDRILRELRALQAERSMGMVYISHDMAVIAEVSDDVAVMYAGRIVEYGGVREIFEDPIHPYTEALMAAFPSVTGERRELSTVAGDPPTLLDPPPGCRFHPRCPLATNECRTQRPPVVRRGRRWAECWHPRGQGVGP